MDFAPFLDGWDLVPDGSPIHTHSSDLLPVRRRGFPAMLKVARSVDEQIGNLLMKWWGGEGAANVLEQNGAALLLERAVAMQSLDRMGIAGQDDEATRILCTIAEKLHANRPHPPPELIPLSEWFAALWRSERRHSEMLSNSAKIARALLASATDIAVLHGDIHHGNVLDFGERGWLAIDPKGLLGERTFDFVNILRNPNSSIALTPGRFSRQVAVICECAGIDRARLLRWTVAFTGLSAAWIIDEGGKPTVDFAIMNIASEELARS